MCGIAGSINFRLNIPVLTQCLLHRGPDEQTTFENDNVQLHHHRLAILDIAGGRQPMHLGPLTIIFNGEIYNHLDVRQKYQLQCITNSDTETILHAFAKVGPACLHAFDGMFALAIYNSEKRQLFLARDRAGKKPLYYYSNSREFVFASELNALHSQLDLRINEQHLQQYMRMGYFYRSSTPYMDVWELPAGSYAYVSCEYPEPAVERWWNIGRFYKERLQVDQATAEAEIDMRLHKSVKDRIESSDLEVASFLSGGIDSGLVTAIGKEYNPRLKTFTVSFDGEYDEAPLARLVAERYGTRHNEIRISFDNLAGDIVKILTNYGEPFFDSSAIPSYYVSKAAKEHVTVILNGDGGDELFGGYRRYVPFARYDFFKPGFLVGNIARAIKTALPIPNNKKSKYNYLYRLAALAGRNGLDTYLAATLDIFEDYEKYLKAEPGILDQVRKDFELVNDSSLSGLQKIMQLDFDNILAGDLLVKMDIATMAHSLEGRSPLLGRDLLEYVPSLPDAYKINGNQTKYLLRQLAKKYLPAELIYQPKRGFEIPLKKWIDVQLKEPIGDYLFSGNAYCKNFVDTSFINKIWSRQVAVGDEKRAKILWTLFALEVWYQNCYRRNA